MRPRPKYRTGPFALDCEDSLRAGQGRVPHPALAILFPADFSLERSITPIFRLHQNLLGTFGVTTRKLFHNSSSLAAKRSLASVGNDREKCEEPCN